MGEQAFAECLPRFKRCLRTTSFARRYELHDVLKEAGFSDVDWKMSAESGYYQPIVTARV